MRKTFTASLRTHFASDLPRGGVASGKEGSLEGLGQSQGLAGLPGRDGRSHVGVRRRRLKKSLVSRSHISLLGRGKGRRNLPAGIDGSGLRKSSALRLWWRRLQGSSIIAFCCEVARSSHLARQQRRGIDGSWTSELSRGCREDGLNLSSHVVVTTKV